MDVLLARKILDQLAQHNTGVMLNGDGETMLHPRFHDIAEYACSLSLPSVFFNTNGTLMTPPFSDRFIRYFKGNVSFSLDGFKESHERLRKGSSYDLVISNIEYLQAQIQSQKLPITIQVCYCNYDQPANEKDDFVAYCLDKVDCISLCDVYDKNYNVISSKPLNLTCKEKRIVCNVPWETFIVRWDGTVICCSSGFSLDNCDTSLGNANREALVDIWFGEKFQKWRYKAENLELAGSICERCERWKMYLFFPDELKDSILIKRSGIFTSYRRISDN
jgi:radical SAM protein with 4Fe4S-binding SPASM domain